MVILEMFCVLPVHNTTMNFKEVYDRHHHMIVGHGLESILLHRSATEARRTLDGQHQQSQYTKWLNSKLSAVKTCTFYALR